MSNCDSKSVLVVEDDSDIRISIESGLNMLGFGVCLASNGKEALELLNEGKRPCLILLDLMMPVMDGYEFRSRQKADPRISDIPVVVISADGNADLKSKQLDAELGMKKPLDFEALFNVVQRFCN